MGCVDLITSPHGRLAFIFFHHITTKLLLWLCDGRKWTPWSLRDISTATVVPQKQFCGYVMEENEHHEVYEIFPLRLWCCVTKRVATVARHILSCAFHSGISLDARCTCFTWPKSEYKSANFGEELQDRTVGTYLKDIAGHFTFRYTPLSCQHSSEHWTPTQHNQMQIHNVQLIFYRLTRLSVVLSLEKGAYPGPKNTHVMYRHTGVLKKIKK